jgi:von Willebrand factor type A domain
MENEQIKQTEIVVVLDRSGSMGSIAKSTVEGFNTFLNEQKNADGEAFMTLIQFDDRYEVNYKSMPIKEVAELIERETYSPRGSTALYDAIGKTINELQTDRDVVFVIITDGYENASKEFKGEAIKKMIETLESENKWKFVYLAANQDAITMGGNIGIKAGSSMTWAATDGGVENTFYAMSANLKSYRSAKTKYEEYVAESVDKTISYADYMTANVDKLSFDDEQRKRSMDEKDKK